MTKPTCLSLLLVVALAAFAQVGCTVPLIADQDVGMDAGPPDVGNDAFMPDVGNDVGRDAADPCLGVDCSSHDDMCNMGVCNPTTGACEAMPLPDTTTCSDGDACTTSDTCSAGVCVGERTGCAPTVTTFQAATFAIGQTNLTSSSVNSGAVGIVPIGLATPIDGPVAVSGRFYVMDSANRRVLIYGSVPTAFGSIPTMALGASDLASAGSTGPNGGQVAGFARGLCTDGTHLGIGDPQANRVQIFDTAPTADAAPDVVIGQPDFATTSAGTSATTVNAPFACAMAAGRLAVADWQNHRVLLWNGIPTTSGAPADLVLGQGAFDEGTVNAGGAVSASTMSSPQNVWTDGDRIVVTDTGNNRVLLWNHWPTVNGTPADIVLGQVDFTGTGPSGGSHGLNQPGQATMSGGQLLIVDTMNHRVLIHNSWPITNNRAADRVLGQSDFTHVTAQDDNQDNVADGTASARTFNRPTGVAVIGTHVFVTDTFEHRILVF